jgi:putative transcriptional regulator
MSKKAFDKIAEGLNEALAVARGELKPAKLHVPPEFNVRATRNKLHLSQEDFAAVFGFTMNQIRDWEQGRSRPLGGVRAYLMIIDRHPDSVMNLLREGVQHAVSDDIEAHEILATAEASAITLTRSPSP